MYIRGLQFLTFFGNLMGLRQRMIATDKTIRITFEKCQKIPFFEHLSETWI
jgi:hypothetical protein